MNLVSSSTFETITKYIKTVKVNGKNFYGMIDPGSSECTIKAFKVVESQFKVVPEAVELRGFGSENFKTVSPGLVIGDIEVDGVEAKGVKIRVVPDEAQKTDLLIGRTFTDLPFVNYAKVGDTLRFTIDETKDQLSIEVPITEERKEVDQESKLKKRLKRKK